MSYREKYGLLLDDLAREADAIAMKSFRTGEIQIDKKEDGSAVTQADRHIEEMVRARIAASGLEMDVLGEEMGGDHSKGPATNGRARLIVDPIDGTEEFSRGVGTFGTLLGIEQDRQIVAAMVGAPALGTRWCAFRGEGAWRNEARIHVSAISPLRAAMVITGGTGPNSRREHVERARRLLDAAKFGRSFGGFWKHMLVAEGAIEAALDLHSKPWDLAPALLIVEEAAGRSTDLQGRRTIYSGNLLSTNGKIHEEVLALLGEPQRVKGKTHKEVLAPLREPQHVKAMVIRIKHVYDPPSKEDGWRVLVERIWPRGLTKASARIDHWMKEVAPSNELRRWFGQVPEKWDQFQRKYREELEAKSRALAQLRKMSEQHGTLTLLLGAKDQEHNQAVVLVDLLQRQRGK